MKRFLSTFVFLLICSITLFGANGILEKLKGIPQISDIKEWEVKPFDEYYQFWFEQPIDHNDPSKGTFKQQVLLGHRNSDAPTIIELDGYTIGPKGAGELASLFEGNQVRIEHRFFDKSVPKGDIPWEDLTIKNAANDQHKIIQSLKEQIYPSTKWISTGISKGGQTTIFHRYFYPEDVDISVPYVAPLNLEYIDPRINKFLSRLGSARVGFSSFFSGGSTQRDCRYIIRDFQMMCFENRAKLLPLFKEYAEARSYTFQAAGGMERAFNLAVLEYPFAFWQWGSNCEEIPNLEVNDLDEIFEYLVQVSPPNFFDDKEIEYLYPFFYGALTEMGMYKYDLKYFKKYLKDEKKDIDFSFTMPKGAVKKPFNSKQMKAINKWLQTDAERILFIYGGIDPWSATAVDLKDNWKCRKYVKADMHHGCRISHFDPVSKEDLIDTLKEWLAEPAD